MNEPANKELEGKVIGCLKIKFKESQLTVKCERQMETILREAALNYHLDPLIVALCAEEVIILLFKFFTQLFQIVLILNLSK